MTKVHYSAEEKNNKLRSNCYDTVISDNMQLKDTIWTAYFHIYLKLVQILYELNSETKWRRRCQKLIKMRTNQMQYVNSRHNITLSHRSIRYIHQYSFTLCVHACSCARLKANYVDRWNRKTSTNGSPRTATPLYVLSSASSWSSRTNMNKNMQHISCTNLLSIQTSIILGQRIPTIRRWL
jgi:hypothetical protein